MIYLVPKFNCVLAGEKNVSLVAGAKYCVENVDNEPRIVFGENGEIPYAINFSDVLFKHDNNFILKAELGADRYLFLYPNIVFNPNSVNFSYNKQQVIVSTGREVSVCVDGEAVVSSSAKVRYSHFVVKGSLCIIYFEGARKFLVVLENKAVKFADFYDDVNVEGENLWFLKRLHDSLNHGKVVEIKNNKFDSYLVYLDDNELKLQSEFCSLVFLDCLMAGNLKYCNSLLSDTLTQEDEKQIKTFFPEFDEIYPVSEKKFILINKNTLAGIYEFDIKDCKIENIICL